MSLARFASVGLLCGAASLSTSAFAAEPDADAQQGALQLELGACLDRQREAIEQVVGLELRRAVKRLPLAAPAALAPTVRVACAGDQLSLTYSWGIHWRGRSLDVSRVTQAALARTVALAVVELVEAPAAVATSRAPLPEQPREEPRSAGEAAAARASISLLATARLFPATSDFSAGVRLRSKVMAHGGTSVLLGVGAERGQAARALGNVTVSAAFVELGLSQDLLRARPFSLALEAEGEAGWVTLAGSPKQNDLTLGQKLTGAWGALQLALAPRLQLSSALELAARGGFGWMLVAPAATSDAQALNIWHGANISVDLGLSLLL